MSPKEIEDLHKSMIGNYQVGQKVRALEILGDSACGDSPGGVYARPGDILIVRSIKPDSKFPISVSHPDIIDRSFGVGANEIEVIESELS